MSRTLLAIIAAIIAFYKNRSAFCWFVATLIFGWWSIICLMLFCEKRSTQ